MLTPEQRVLRARMGGLTTSLRGHTTTAAARAAFLNRFDELVDPDRVLSTDERVRRSGAARKAHMTRLALKSSLVRGKKRAGPADIGPALEDDDGVRRPATA